MAEVEAALFELPFKHVAAFAMEARADNREERTSKAWWLHRRSGEMVRDKLRGLDRFIATGLVTKYRYFVWRKTAGLLPDTRVVVIPRDDDCAFGVLSSRIHTVWTLATCQYHGVGNDPVYTPSTCFETFPFPEGLTPNLPASTYANDPRAVAIAEAARDLNDKREAWLNPPEWVERVPEVVPGYPDRIVAKPGHEEDLKKRTLTKLYNAREPWLVHLHQRLDAAVAAAYGWPADLSDEEILEKLFALNQERAKAGR